MKHKTLMRKIDDAIVEGLRARLYHARKAGLISLDAEEKLHLAANEVSADVRRIVRDSVGVEVVR